MKVFKIFNPESDAMRILLIVLGSLFSTLVLTFSVLAIVNMREQAFDKASAYLLVVFVVLGFSRLITFFKSRSKSSLVRLLTLFVFDVSLGIVVYFGRYNTYLYCLSGGLFCLTVIFSRCFKIYMNHTLRSIVFNGLLILFFGFLAVGLFIPTDVEDIYSPVIVLCFIVAISALLEVLSGAVSSLNVKTLFKIIIKTYALEIILGLLTTMVASALVLMVFEESITTFSDGLWFAFETVTTIGFGDFEVLSLVGRLIVVFLGIYGIIVVAVITSIIVNFYNETSGKDDKESFKEIKKETKKKGK